MKEGSFDSWTDLFNSKIRDFDNPGTPVLHAWLPTNRLDEPIQTFTHNPYYWKVDAEGRQLPYIDEIQRTLVTNPEALLLKAIAGEVDFQSRRIRSLGNYPVAAENRDKGGYQMIQCISLGKNFGSIFFNYHHKDPQLREIFWDKRFRVAMSVAINREEISDLIYMGLAPPSQPAAPEGTAWYDRQSTLAPGEHRDPGVDKRLPEGSRH